MPVFAGVDALVVYLAYRNHDAALLGAALAVAGSLIGSFFLYFLARKGGDRFLARYTASGKGAALHSWFKEYGMLTVFVPAVLPIPLPMKIPVLCAGALGVSPLTFALTLIVARTIRYFGLAWMGTQLGPDTIPFLKHHVWQMLLLAVLLFAVLYFLVRLRNRRRGNVASV